MVDYRGFYINMAESTERRKAVEANLQQLGISEHYERSEAIVGADVFTQYETNQSPASLGASLSHHQLLKENTGSDRHLHIIEDDTILHRLVPQT